MTIDQAESILQAVRIMEEESTSDGRPSCVDDADWRSWVKDAIFVALEDASEYEHYAHIPLVAELWGELDEAGAWDYDDPYDGDPRNEVADLADTFEFVTREGCDECIVYAGYSVDGLHLKIAGRISRVLPVLRAAHGI